MKQYHPRSLAYLGDALYELWIREWMLEKTQDSEALHKQTVAFVRAETQAKVLTAIEAHLTEAEKDLARRSRNVITTPKGRKIGQKDYRDASALEALIGYCYYETPERIDVIKKTILKHLESLNLLADSPL